MKKVLFVCTHNSARSQMAEGLVNYYHNSYFMAYSAGTERTKVNPLAIKAMSQLGIDISHHYSKHINDFMDQSYDLVVTVCDNANETCPYFPNAGSRKHVSFPDPSEVKGTEEEKLEAFARTRDKIRDTLPGILGL